MGGGGEGQFVITSPHDDDSLKIMDQGREGQQYRGVLQARLYFLVWGSYSDHLGTVAITLPPDTISTVRSFDEIS
jgi:hypothetical protein